MKKNILAIIPARGGSKGIPRKNVKLFNGIPLIYYSIKCALESSHINRVIVSTDDAEIAEIAIKCGAEVPFVRPTEISGDISTDYEFIHHCLEWLHVCEPNYTIELIIQLRPTYPLRNIHTIDGCIENMLKEENNHFDSLRTVIENDKPPFKMYTIDNGILVPLFMECNGSKEPYNMPRQQLPVSYWHNGYIDIIRPATIMTKKSVCGDKILPYILDPSEIYDIDTLSEWNNAENLHKENLHIN
jgi:CMP-N-acetylneuraminic acid synthetase